MPCRASPIPRCSRVLMLWLVALWWLAAASAGPPADWPGDYLGLGGAPNRMQIAPAGTGRLEIVWTGGGDDRAGAATAATCTAVAWAASDSPTAGALRAELQPFRRGEAALDAADLAALKPGPIMLTTPEAVAPARLVRVAGMFPHCGLQASLGGPYWRPAAATAAPHDLTPDFHRCSAPQAACLAAEHARQDRRLNQAYQALLAALGPAARTAVRQAQRGWLAERDGLCAAAAERLACLAQAGAHRADELAALARISLEATARSR